MNRTNRRSTIAIVFAMLWAGGMHAQDISQIAKSDPLIITGAVGTQNTYYHSSVGDGYASPMNNMVYANLNISLYGMSMPFSFYYTNDNTSFNYPHISFHISPRYKNWSLHFGQSSMNYSSYVMSMPFNGYGVEYQGDKLRFGAFYGTLRKAVNDDPTNPAARSPQYKRTGWGMKVGYGSRGNYLDIYFLRAYDRLKSLDERWANTVSPQDNMVLGIRGGLSYSDHFSLTANLAVSLLSLDKKGTIVTNDEAERFDKIFDARYSTIARYAGDVNLNLSYSGFNASVFYRQIQPDYTSLGTYYMSNNYHALGVNLSTVLLRRLSLSASFSGQEDNLTNKQLYTTRGFIYNANASTRFGNLGLAVGYNGYRQLQGDGTAHVNDTTRVNRIMNSLYVTPSYMIAGNHLTHTISLSGSYTNNEDLNPFAIGESDVTTYAVGASYNLGVQDWNMDFTTSLSHQRSDGYQRQYTSDVLSLTTGRSFLKENNLNAQLTLSMCYNEVKNQMKSLSLGADMEVGYTLNKVHVFSLSAGINKYGDVNVTRRSSNLDDTEYNVGFNYTYTFSLLEIKRKNEKQPE